ncbi:MAG: hypothetical protein AAFR62_14160 [Cyanobacteria bacterium J06629_2]
MLSSSLISNYFGIERYQEIGLLLYSTVMRPSRADIGISCIDRWYGNNTSCSIKLCSINILTSEKFLIALGEDGDRPIYVAQLGEIPQIVVQLTTNN